MSKAASVFSLQSTPQKSHRLALVSFLAMTSLIAQTSYAVDEHGCTDKQYWSSFMGRCETTQQVTVTGQRDNSFANQLQNQKLPNDPSVAALPNVAAPPQSAEQQWQQMANDSVNNINAQAPKTVDVTANSEVTANIHGSKDAVAEFSGAKKPGQGNGQDDSSDKCKNSVYIDGKYQCDSTYRFMDNAKLANQLTNASGNIAVTASGTAANIKAQDAGTQSAVAEAQASTMEKAGALQTLSGLANAALGAWQVKLALKHRDNEKELSQKQAEQAKQSPNSVTGDVTVYSAGEFKAAKAEQNKAQQDAMAQGALAILQGGQQAAAGAMAIAAAKQAKELAGKLSNATGTSYQINSANPTDLTNTGTTSTAINPGTATDPAVATTDGNIKANDVPNITPPVNPDATPSGPGGGPVAGGFTPGNPQDAGGGGGNPGIGVGSMQAAKGDPEPTGPKMADTKGNSSYAQGSGAGFAAGGGVSAEKSADLGFLANLLPKPQEEMAKNGILDYGGGRSPASMAPYSFLGKDVNIFQRISDRTTAKFKSGDVGGS